MENLRKHRYWVWLSMIPNLGSIKKQRLLEIYKNAEGIYNASYEELLRIDGIGEKIAKSIVDEKFRLQIEKNLEYMYMNKIGIISIFDLDYPNNLKKIYDAPISLYYKGNIKILNGNNIAIIGCRQASEYGKKSANYFAYNLAKNNLNIVSGLARGIDSYAHIGCILGNGKTIAVVGCSLDRVYPEENKNLQEKIIESGGVVISEYPLGTKPEKMNFPARNRIISGISKGVLVVEAKEKSGTLITVDCALEQGKEVYVVPGNINAVNSVGTNELIKCGARLVTDFRELLE